jgi:hypothetical protein
MQSVSAEFTTATNDIARRVVACLEVSWDGTGLIGAARSAAGWTDETTYMVEHRGSMKINPPGDDLVAAGEVGSATILLDNSTRRFSWLKTDGPLYAYIGGVNGFVGIPVRIWEGFITPGGTQYCRIFTGVITGWTEQTSEASVKLECKDIGWKYLQNRLSSVLYQDQFADEWITYVAQTLAGIDAGDMDLDGGIYQISWLWLDDESAVEEIWEAAAADGGLAYFDELGKLCYRNPMAWVGLASVWDFTEDRYESAEPRMDPSALATKIIVEWSGRYRDAPDELYNERSIKYVSPSDSIEFTARFSNGAIEVYNPDSAQPYEDFHASSAGGQDLTAYLTVTLSDVCGQQCTVTIANSHTVCTAIVDHLRIRGAPLMGGPTEQAEAVPAVPPLDFERVRSVRGNLYCQTIEQGESLANLLALRCARIRPVWALRGVPGVPQLELGDRVTFHDKWAITGDVRDGITTGIDWQGTEDGFQQTLNIMDLADLSQYTDYFIIGVTALGVHGRCWY